MSAACRAVLALPALLHGQSIPRTWATAAVASLETPLAQPAFSPVQISEDVYYRIPERVLYKTYTVYAPGREPSGYMERLKQQEPEVAFKPSDYHTPAEWIAAGELVFNAPTSFDPVFFSAADLRDLSFFSASGMPVAADGTVPFARWIIRKKGSVELGSMSCATCHTRVLHDGRIVPGAPSNNPADREGADLVRRAVLRRRIRCWRGFAASRGNSKFPGFPAIQTPPLGISRWLNSSKPAKPSRPA